MASGQSVSSSSSLMLPGSKNGTARKATRVSDPWSSVFVVEDHGSSIMRRLDRQRADARSLCDMKLTSSYDGEQFPCHRAVLAEQSEFVANFLEHNELAFGGDVEVPQDGDMIRSLLDFVYSGLLDIDESCCWRLYSTVRFFRMTSTALQDEIFGVLLKLLSDSDVDFLKSADFLNISLNDMPRVFDVLMQGATKLGPSVQIRLLEALGKWANNDFNRRGQFFLEIDQKYQLSLDLTDE